MQDLARPNAVFNIKQQEKSHTSTNGSASLEIWLRSVVRVALCFLCEPDQGNCLCYLVESAGSCVYTSF